MRYNRREFLKHAGSYLVVTALTGTPFVFAEGNPYKIKKEKLDNDSDEILLARMIFGEARNVSTSEKIVIGFTPVNRARDRKSYDGRTLKEAILKSKSKMINKNGEEKEIIIHQYSCFNSWDPNLEKLINPSEYDSKEWTRCRKVSRDILQGKYDSYNFGPTHYHLKGMFPLPGWVKGMREKLDSTGFKHQFYREG